MSDAEEVAHSEHTNIWCDKLLACVNWRLEFMQASFKPFHVGLFKTLYQYNSAGTLIFCSKNYQATNLNLFTAIRIQPTEVILCLCPQNKENSLFLVTDKFSKFAITEVFELISS